MIEGDAISRFYLDFSGFHGLRSQAREGSVRAVEEVASQFESLFLQFALKAMRQAGFGDGLLDNDQSRFYQGLLDQQLALSMTGNGGTLGLARMIARQLESAPHARASTEASMLHSGPAALKKIAVRAANQYKEVERLAPPVAAVANAGAWNDGVSARVERAPPSAITLMESGPSIGDITSSREAFVRGLWPLAEDAGRELGVSPAVLIAQAALETGWGRSVMRRADGTSGHNLFGIKADDQWRGDRIMARTWEVNDGARVTETAAFRAYGSFAESFDDYVTFLHANPRYRGAMRVASDPEAFADALQRAGFATDPHYAGKIKSILRGSIDTLQTSTGVVPKEASPASG